MATASDLTERLEKLEQDLALLKSDLQGSIESTERRVAELEEQLATQREELSLVDAAIRALNGQPATPPPPPPPPGT